MPRFRLPLAVLLFALHLLSSDVLVSCNPAGNHGQVGLGYSGRLNIVSILDETTASACLAKVHSIIESIKPSSRKRLFFRFLMLGEPTKKRYEQWEKAMSCFNVDFETQLWRGMPTSPLAKAISGKLFNTEYIMARIYFVDYFPDMHENEQSKYLYLDNDAFVTCDIEELFSAPLFTHASVAAVRDYRLQQQALKQTHAHADIHTTHQLHDKVRAAHAAKAQETLTREAHFPLHEEAVIGLVVEAHHLNGGYIASNFNHTHPRVKSFIHRQKKDVFFNGGVAMVRIDLWKNRNITKRAEELLLENASGGMGTVWSDSAGDQGLFYVLFQGTHFANLDAKYNMRRLPKKTTHMLNEGVLGIVHLAGSTNGHIETICHDPLRYPLFLPNVVPLYLSIIHSYMQKCEAYATHEGHITPYSFSGACSTAIHAVSEHLALALASADGGGAVNYNPGLGPFGWPIKPLLPMTKADAAG